MSSLQPSLSIAAQIGRSSGGPFVELPAGLLTCASPACSRLLRSPQWPAFAPEHASALTAAVPSMICTWFSSLPERPAAAPGTASFRCSNTKNIPHPPALVHKDFPRSGGLPMAGICGRIMRREEMRRETQRLFCRRLLLVHRAGVRSAAGGLRRGQRLVRRQGGEPRLRGSEGPAHRPSGDRLCGI